ncbi:hypothetical protein WAI453_010342 [Rhynchosporium graminicola]
MAITSLPSQTMATIKAKAASLPKLQRSKKGSKEPRSPRSPVQEVHEPISTGPIQPAPETTTAPTLQPFDIPRARHAKKGQAQPVAQTATMPETVQVPILRPMDIPRPVHAKKGQTSKAPDGSTPTLQGLEIPRPMKKNPAVQHPTETTEMSESGIPAFAPTPTLQPFDIPRPVHAKKEAAAAPTLQPFNIPRPVHAKKGGGTSPTKKDALRTTVLAPSQPPTQTQTVPTTQTGTLSYPPRTGHPLFPPLPSYGPPTIKNRVIWTLRQLLSQFLTGIGIFVILIAYLLHGVKKRFVWLLSMHSLPPRPFQAEEDRRAEIRKLDSLAWTKKEKQQKSPLPDITAGADVEAFPANVGGKDGFVPTEGGPDKLVVDIGYYARRVGLDSEEVKVQTEDGFVLDLWHIYDPKEYTPLTRAQRMVRGPENIDAIRAPSRALDGGVGEKGKEREGEKKQKYPVLMMHGLLQSSGVYCTNDEHSLAFWLCKQGYDVWLGNSRCGFEPEHVEFKTGDPRMWNWNITHMATLDLPALTARVLSETSSLKLGLVAHSQGTTQTLIALSKHQRPSLSSKLSVFCALAPAAYAGPLLNSRFHFKFLRLIPVSLFRAIFGVKSFLPQISFFTKLRGKSPGLQGMIGKISYHVYNYLFAWGDARWDRGVRDRCFMFAPTFISVEAMKWWLSKDGFANHGCILSDKGRLQRDVEEDLLQDYFRDGPGCIDEPFATELLEKHVREPRVNESWFLDPEGEEADGLGESRMAATPPMAFWVAGEDTICDGKELLNRFERGREPGVRILDGGRNIIEGYSHLDVVWACDVIEKVGWGVRDALWSTVGNEGKDRWRVPVGVDNVEAWVDDRVYAGGRRRSDQSTDLEGSETEKERGSVGRNV